MLQDEATTLKLEKQCGFEYADFRKLAGESDVYKMWLTPMQAIFPIQNAESAGRTSLFILAIRKYLKELFSMLHAFLSVSKRFLGDIIRLWTDPQRGN
jgi:hypothetical protein